MGGRYFKQGAGAGRHGHSQSRGELVDSVRKKQNVQELPAKNYHICVFNYRRKDRGDTGRGDRLKGHI